MAQNKQYNVHPGIANKLVLPNITINLIQCPADGIVQSSAIPDGCFKENNTTIQLN